MNNIVLKDELSHMEYIWRGCLPYRESLVLQEQLKEKACGSRQIFFIGFECPSCITLGLRGKKAEDLVKSVEEYNKQDIEVVSIKRGGQATIHSLGQLVIYPVMDLLQWKIRLRDFLGILEMVTSDTLKELGVATTKKEKFAGLFTEKGKIVFFGVHISKGVSQHGLAINVHNSLSLFDLIRSCGVNNRSHDSLKNNGVTVKLYNLFSLWCEKARNVFIRRR